MRASAIAAIAFFAVTATAAPGTDAQARCKADKCRSAVLIDSTKNPTAAASAKKDCSSFLLTRVSPCPSTATSTSTVTRQAPGATSYSTSTVVSPKCRTVTESTTTTAEVKRYETVTSTETTTDTTTVTDTSRQTNVHTVTLPSTSTIEELRTSTKLVIITPTASGDATITEYKTTTKVVSVVQRGPTPTSNPQARRAVPKCSPRKLTASKLPTSVSRLCTASSAYASACLCAGNTRRMTTLPTPTVTKCFTVTSTRTPTTTIQVLITQPGDCVETTTQTVNEQKFTTITETEHETVTDKATVTVSTTEVVEKEETTYTPAGTVTTTRTVIEEATTTACPLKQLSGPGSEQEKRLKFSFPYNPAFWTVNVNEAAYWYLDLGGYLCSSGHRAFFYGSYSGLFLEGSGSIDPSQSRMRCSFTSDVLRCTRENGVPGEFYGITRSKQYLYFGDDAGDPNLLPVCVGRACPQYQATVTVTSTHTVQATTTACPIKQVGNSTFGGKSYDGYYLTGEGGNPYWEDLGGSNLFLYLNGDSYLTSTSGLYLVSSATYTTFTYLTAIDYYNPEQYDEWAIKCEILANQELSCVTAGPGPNNEFKRFGFIGDYLGWGTAGQQGSFPSEGIRISRDCGDGSNE